MLLKSLVMLTFLAAHGLPASHHPPDHHKHIAHRALDAELDALSQDLEEADEEADEFKRLMEGELEREMGDLESELQTCYKIAGDLATCDFKKTETTCDAKICTKLDALSFEGVDEINRAAKVKQWTTHYLDKKTNECNEQPKPLVYFGCCRCHVDENKADHFNVKGCEGKCNVDEKAFQLFSDGTMKIHDCTASSPAAEWKEFETTTDDGYGTGGKRFQVLDTFGYLPGMKHKGVSYGKEMYGDKGIKITKETNGKKTIALKLGNKLTIGCSHGCARTKAGAPRGRAVHTPPRRAARSTPTSATYKSYGWSEHARTSSNGGLLDLREGTHFDGDELGKWFGPMDLDRCHTMMEAIYDTKLGPGRKTRAYVRTMPSLRCLHQHISSCSHPPPAPTLPPSPPSHLPLCAEPPRGEHAALEEVRQGCPHGRW